MSQTVITLAFERWKAQQAINNSAVVLDEFVLANVPNLDVENPIDRAEQLPEAKYIVHRQAVSAAGLVNENSVVYSVTMGADVGDFDFNWVGLVNKATGTLAMIVHAPLQSKIKNAEGKQGNVLTRSFLMEYNGAASETQITTPAETWQIDFTARLSGMDERQRLENVDIYGAAAFFSDGFLVTRQVSQYSITQGIGYVGGLRCKLPTTQNITVTTKPVKVWVDVCWKGTLTSVWAEELKITVANTLANYVQDGVQHYVFAVASIDANGVITDLRPKGTLDNQQGNKDFLRIDKSLSEIAAKGEAAQVLARKNLALGDVATKNVVTSMTDATAGRIPVVGWMGLGGLTPAVGTDNLTCFYYGGVGAATNPLNDRGFAFVNLAVSGSYRCRLAMDYTHAAPRIFYQNILDKTYNPYVEFYTTARKPTANDVGAIPFFGGISAGTNLNTLTEPGIWFNSANVNATLALNYPSTNAGSLQVLRDAGTTQIYTEYASQRQFRRGLYSGTWNPWRLVYDSGNKPSASDVGALPISGGTLNGNLTVKNQIQVGGVGNGMLNIGDSDSGLRSSVDGQVDLYANGRMYGYWNTGVFSFTGQMIPANYNNFDARYIQNTQMGAEEYKDIPYPGQASLPLGACPTAFVGTTKSTGSGISFHISRVYFRRLQKYIGGSWKNVA